MKKSLEWRWWLAVGVFAVVIFIGAVVPVAEGVSVPYLDKAVHGGEYLAFAWLLVHAIRASRVESSESRQYAIWVWIYATSYGLLMEAIQLLIPWRSGDLADALANALGAAAGVWVGRRLPRHPDATLPARQ